MALKQLLESITKKIRIIEEERVSKNVFGGAGWIGVYVPKSIGKALQLKKDANYGYLLYSASSNGAFDLLEDEVRDLVKNWKILNENNKHIDTDVKIRAVLG